MDEAPTIPVDDSPALAPIAKSRRWYQLHRSTWLIMPLGLAVAVLIDLPGGTGWYPDYDSWMAREAVVHGWPMTFLWRTPQGWRNMPEDAKPNLPWNFADSTRHFLFLPLAIDVVVAAAGLAIFATLVEWRRRRLQRFAQFSLRELLIVITLVAIALGCWNQRYRADQELWRHWSRIKGTSVRPVPQLPLWLRSLNWRGPFRSLAPVGLSDFRVRVIGGWGPRPTLFSSIDWETSPQDDIRPFIERFPSEIEISMDHGVSDEDVAALPTFYRLERLAVVCSEYPDITRLLACLPKLQYLRRLSLRTSGEATMGDGGLNVLTKLPSQLKSLSIRNRSRFKEQGLVELGRFKELTELHLCDVELPQDGLTRLANMKQLRQLDLAGSDLAEADLSQLGQIDGLEELNLRGVALADDGADRLRALHELRWLSLAQTKATAAGLKAMLRPSAEDPRPFERLKHLDIQLSAIERGVLKHVETLKNLEELHCDTRQIDDEAIAAFRKLTKLNRLDLEVFGDASPDPQLKLKLQQALPDCEIITH
jgi:hypothetical protein